jgi:hypothetical protein
MALRAFRDMVIEQIRPLYQSQLILAKGVTHVYRVTIGERGGRSDPELVTDQDELHEAVQAIEAGAGYGDVAEDVGGEDASELRTAITS